jgi:hypothetical protein
MLDNYDIVSEAGVVVENRLELLQDLVELKKIQMDIRSRLICRCASCRSEQETTLAWLHSFREQDSKAG